MALAGYQFAPGTMNPAYRSGIQNPGLGVQQGAEALKSLSLRLPNILGGQPIAPEGLLQPRTGGATPTSFALQRQLGVSQPQAPQRLGPQAPQQLGGTVPPYEGTPYWLTPEGMARAAAERGQSQFGQQMSQPFGGQNPFGSGGSDQGMQFDPGSAYAPPVSVGFNYGGNPSNPNPQPPQGSYAPPQFSGYSGGYGGRDFGERTQV